MIQHGDTGDRRCNIASRRCGNDQLLFLKLFATSMMRLCIFNDRGRNTVFAAYGIVKFDAFGIPATCAA
jgi:hypothetical protein